MSGINMRYIENLPSTITTIKSNQIDNDENTEGNRKNLSGRIYRRIFKQTPPEISPQFSRLEDRYAHQVSNN